jgi:hypothetical protein
MMLHDLVLGLFMNRYEFALPVSEAIRKPASIVVHFSGRLLAVMKGRATAWSKPVQHQMDVTHLDHRRT